MLKEKLNVLISGNKISNIYSLIANIDSLEYDFNTEEYLKSLYIRILNSDYQNKKTLLVCLKHKLDEFMKYEKEKRGNHNIEFMLNNNEIDDEVISYMDFLIETMDYRLSNNQGNSDEQKVLDQYIEYEMGIDYIDFKVRSQIDRYFKIKESYYKKCKLLEKKVTSRSGVVTLIIIIELMIIGIFTLMFKQL